MSLQNRVTPFGNLLATPARGLLMGNRGGKFHEPGRNLRTRRWASKQWICCQLAFKNRRRKVWGDGYTELFFLDEVTALAAGHRPCFECRRADALAFASRFPGARTAPEMDVILHRERLDGKSKRLHRCNIDELPDGAIVARGEDAFAVRGRHLLRWTPAGFAETELRPRAGSVDVLTPPSIVAVLSNGYQPHWHETAQGGSIGSTGASTGAAGTRGVQAK